MSKFKKALLLVAAWATVAALAITGTVAYLTSEDSDVNVMTLGNVSIAQNEYQRVVNADGSYKTDTVDNQTSYVLEAFKQGKAILPIVGDPSSPNGFAYAGYDSTTVRMSQVGSYGGMTVFAGKNAVDKFVTVKNTGKSDAYIRTLVAVEVGSADPELLGTSYHQTWKEIPVGIISIDGNNYSLTEYLYQGGQLSDGSWRHAAGILPAGDTSYPNLSQVYIGSEATNEDCKALDGNGNGTLDILVLSQACQVEGFDDAQTALDTAFGKVIDKGAEWLGGVIARKTVKTWDGTVDTSWYNDTDTVFSIKTPAQLAGLAELVDGGNTFEGKTVALSANLDMKKLDENGEPISFEPIGSYVNGQSFKGTFDGQDFTISNVYQNGWALANGYWDGPDYGMGLFAVVEDATVKNLVLEGSSLPSQANIMGTVAGLAANCTFENITVKDAYVGNHSWYSGGLVGWAEGDVKFINCDVDADTSISSQWGDFNNANGGIVGGIAPTGTYYFEDCDIACRIDAYNDVTSAYEWYSYRSCGMLIGDTGQIDDPDGNNVGNAIAPNVTCKDVTVTYGDWANYHYCEFGSSGYPFCRVEAGDSTGAYGNARVGEYYDADGNKVVDDSHTHNAGEKHNELIVFDQLYGGPSGDRYCTYGTATHDGVTVIYNNK